MGRRMKIHALGTGRPDTVAFRIWNPDGHYETLIVVNVRTGERYEWAWESANRVVALCGGRFLP
jgi:hypothetical protein